MLSWNLPILILLQFLIVPSQFRRVWDSLTIKVNCCLQRPIKVITQVQIELISRFSGGRHEAGSCGIAALDDYFRRRLETVSDGLGEILDRHSLLGADIVGGSGFALDENG